MSARNDMALVKRLAGGDCLRPLALPSSFTPVLPSSLDSVGDGAPAALSTSGARGLPPHLGWVAIGDLVIDESYQRPVDRHGWAHVARIAADFRWSAFGTVIIAPVEGTGGESGFRQLYAVIDGQHRSLAALAAGLEKLPCTVLRLNRAGQARAFAEINGEVMQISSFHVYRAALAAGEPWAVAAQSICAESGCVLMEANSSASDKKPGQIFAHRLMREIGARKSWHLPARVALSAWRAATAEVSVQLWRAPILSAWFNAVLQFEDFWPRKDAWRGFAALLRSGHVDILAAIERAEEIQRQRRREGRQAGHFAGLLELQFSDAISGSAPNPAAFERWIDRSIILPDPPGGGDGR